MKKIILLIVVLLASQILFSKTVILSGFKPVREKRYEFISTSFKKYVVENIKNSDIEILDEKKDE